MPPIRRSTDRRRRVLYHAHVAPQAPSTPAARRAAEQLREARQPAKVFGSRVNRHLRSRWFSLVPVSRTAITAFVGAIGTVACVISILHHLAMTWQPLAYRESIARPLLINRPDSFASWWTAAMILLASGVSILIYGLRRHRSDDYRGHYRLWRIALIVLLVAHVHVSVDLIGWLGGFLDWGFGDRAVLSGAHWLRIVLDVGGIILAMRLIAEVFRCRASLSMMIVSSACFGFSEAAAWNIISIESPLIATMVLAAPVVGVSCFAAASTIYLRHLYRQVRNIQPSPTLRKRFRTWNRQRLEAKAELSLLATDELPTRRPAAADQSARPQVAAETRTEQSVTKPSAATEQKSKSKQSTEPDQSATSRPGLFSRLKRSPKPQDSKPQESKEPVSKSDESVTPKKGWFSGLRRRPPTLTDTDSSADETRERSANQPVENPQQKTGGSGSSQAGGPLSARARGQTEKPKPAPPSAMNDEGELPDPEDIDWESMSKSERRRMRKRLKREGRAA